MTGNTRILDRFAYHTEDLDCSLCIHKTRKSKHRKIACEYDIYYNSAALNGNTVSFANNKLNSLEIVKLDSVTKNPLSGAMFTVDKANGERVGSYRTDASGKILMLKQTVKMIFRVGESFGDMAAGQ